MRETYPVSILEIRRHAERMNLQDNQSALSAVGRAMCDRLAKEAPQYAVVVSSPLPRAKETAERIAGRLDGTDPALLPDLGGAAARMFGEMRRSPTGSSSGAPTRARVIRRGSSRLFAHRVARG